LQFPAAFVRLELSGVAWENRVGKVFLGGALVSLRVDMRQYRSESSLNVAL
jgi:hypothetical protein